MVPCWPRSHGGPPDAEWQMVSPQMPQSVDGRDKCTDGEGLVSKFPVNVVCSFVFFLGQND